MDVDRAVLERALAAFIAKCGDPQIGYFGCCGSKRATDMARASAIELRSILLSSQAALV